LHARCDSFVVEKNVHYPTDWNLLCDAIRCAIRVTASACKKHRIKGWRQRHHHYSTIRNLGLKSSRLSRSRSKDPVKKADKEEEVKSSWQFFIDRCDMVIAKIDSSIKSLTDKNVDNSLCAAVEEINGYLAHVRRQKEQLYSRVILDEQVAHNEKVFSIFEPDTEWVSKGKAGVPVEFGLKVCPVTCQYGFVLQHKVMEQESDSDIAVSLTKSTTEKFSNIKSCSFDKGFYSAQNRATLDRIIDNVIMPKKGKLSLKDKEIEGDKEWRLLKHKHSAIESNINALEVHGLDRCPDKGNKGFKRYVALAMVAYNIHQFGAIIQKKALQQRKRIETRRQRAAA